MSNQNEMRRLHLLSVVHTQMELIQGFSLAHRTQISISANSLPPNSTMCVQYALCIPYRYVIVDVFLAFDT